REKMHLLKASSYENLWSLLATFALASAPPWKLCAYLFHLFGAEHKREKSAIEKLEESPLDIVMTKNNPFCVIIVHIDSLIVATKSVCILKFLLNDMEEQ
ncbi:hypothetical protein AABB24_001027, partial [Solanum stoloniferum]